MLSQSRHFLSKAAELCFLRFEVMPGRIVSLILGLRGLRGQYSRRSVLVVVELLFPTPQIMHVLGGLGGGQIETVSRSPQRLEYPFAGPRGGDGRYASGNESSETRPLALEKIDGKRDRALVDSGTSFLLKSSVGSFGFDTIMLERLAHPGPTVIQIRIRSTPSTSAKGRRIR